MKKVFYFLLSVLICATSFFSITACAYRYSISKTDISINIDDSKWYVFTRDNLRNNSELDELGISYDYIHSFMYENDVYLDAAYFYTGSNECLELFLSKKDIEDDIDIVYLSTYSDTEVEKLAKSLAEKMGSAEYCIYKTQYKFMKVECYKSGYHIMLYCTTVNGDNYTLSFQSTSPFTDWEYQEMNDIVDSIEFDVDSVPLTNVPNTESFFDSVPEEAIGGAVIALVAGGISLFKDRRKRKCKNNSISDNGDNIYNDEIVNFRLPSGCIVDMSVDCHDNLYCNFTESQLFSFNTFINAGLYFPQIMQFAAVIVAILNGKTSWSDILLCNLISGVVFTLAWFWGRLYKIPGLSFVSCLIGGNIFRFFLHFIAIGIIAFFVVKDWKVLLFCAIGGIIAYIVRIMFFAHLSNVKYNDEVVRYVSRFRYKY